MLLLTGFSSALFLLAAAAEGDLPSQLDFFERKIRPVLVERCYSCHGPDAAKPKGGFRLATREGLLRGGGRGPAIVPGEPGKSLLLLAIRRADPELKMPPQGGLSAEQVADFAAWIAGGAADPRAGKPAGEAAAAASAPPAGKLWAPQPLRDPPPPAVADSSWPASPIDQFILAALEERGLRPAPPADRRTLIRRATQDLHGLPPSAEEVEAFERDPSPRA